MAASRRWTLTGTFWQWFGCAPAGVGPLEVRFAHPVRLSPDTHSQGHGRPCLQRSHPPPPGLLWHMVFTDGHNSLHSFSTTPLLNKYYKNAKVWSLFVHLFRGSGKTHVRMNKQYSTPNMRYQRIWQDGDECCCSPCTCLKFSRFRNKD